MKRLSALAAAALLIGAILFGIDFYRHRYVRDNRDLVRLLPAGDLTLVYADIGLLRKAQLLGLVSNIKVAPDKEYDDFIRQAGFDYTRDLDAIVIGIDPVQTFMIGRGRFHWDQLRGFALAHQGACQAEACRVPATTPGRWVNFLTIQPDVLAVAVSPNDAGADELRPPGRRVQEEIPDAPVWAKFSHQLLSNPTSLPLPAQIFAISMQSAHFVEMAARPQSLNLKARFENGPAADTARRQLEIQTRTLTSALLKKDEKPDPATFAGLLTQGSFQVVGTDLLGIWPLRPELLRALQ